MCVHHPNFLDNRMYAAFIKGTDEMLIGGGNDRLLPFVSLDPKNKPTQIRVDDFMYDVEYRQVYIGVYVYDKETFARQGVVTTYTKEAQQCRGWKVSQKPNIDKAIDEAKKIAEKRYEAKLHEFQETVNIQ